VYRQGDKRRKKWRMNPVIVGGEVGETIESYYPLKTTSTNILKWKEIKRDLIALCF